MRRRRTTHQPGASPFPPSPRSPSHCVRAHPTEEVARQTSWVKWPVSVLEGIGRTSVLFSPVQCSPVQSRVHPSKPTFTNTSTISKHMGNPPAPLSPLLPRLLRTHKEIRTHLNPPSSKSYPSLSSPHALTALSTSAYPAARFSPAGPPECSNAHCSLQACAVAASDSFQDSGAAACWRRNRFVVLSRAVWKVGVDVYCGDGDDEEEVGEESWGEEEARALGRETERIRRERERERRGKVKPGRSMVGRAGGFEMG